MVGDPALEIVPAVVIERLQFARGHVAQVGVEDLRVALVHLDDDVLLHARHAVEIVQGAGAHALLGGEGLGGGAVDAGAEHDEVLVAVDVAAVYDAFALPEVAADVTDGVMGHLGGGAVADLLHKEVHPVLPRRPVAEVLAVRADAEAGLLGVLEEVPHGDGGGRGHRGVGHGGAVTSTAGAEQGEPGHQSGADHGSHGHAELDLDGKGLLQDPH